MLLTWIVLAGNNIGASGARDISKALEHNSTLQHLNLCGMRASAMHVEYRHMMDACGIFVKSKHMDVADLYCFLSFLFYVQTIK